MKIAFCQATYEKDFNETITCIERVNPYVDCTIIVYDQTLTKEQIDSLTKYNVIPVFHQFKDNLPEMRNAYITKAKSLNIDWICVSDPDELYSENLAKNLKNLITKYDNEGYNRISVPVRDQFDNVEWLDNLDIIKETPGGYRDSNYWKPLLIFKVLPDIHYEGVGTERNVHETLVMKSSVKSINLSKEYYYIHKKSALKIWRNAARNFFISGGGDNVGNINPLWLPLKNIMLNLNINTWNKFEKFVTSSTTTSTITINELKEWLIRALKSPPTNWGTETRETAKWYFYFHKDKIDEYIKNLLEKTPKFTKEIQIENFVTRMYFNILGRPPDEHGKNIYTKHIMENKISAADLVDIFKDSEEYKQKFGEKTYISHIKPQKIYEQTKYSNIKIDTSKYDTVSLCIMGFHSAFNMIKESIEIIGSEVDEIHVQGDDFTEEDIIQFQNIIPNKKMIHIHKEPWIDEFSDYKNKAISYATTEWVLIMDHDEIPTKELADNLKKIIKESERGNSYDIVSFDVIDVRTVNNNITSEVRCQSGKPLLHWNIPSPYTGNPHIWLKRSYYPWKQTHKNFAYKHIKEINSILPNSVRNVLLGGGSDNSREKNPKWNDLRSITNKLNIKTWKEFNDYLIKGNIDRRLIDVLIELSNLQWKDDELKDPLRYYILLHPDEEEYIENKNYRQKKFGDEISWEEHVNEVLKEKLIYYPYNPEWDRIQYLKKYKPNGGKLLDAGCFIGRYLNQFKGAGYDYTGVDQSQYAIDTAKKFNPNDNFICKFLWDIDFENEFDVIVTKTVLQHNNHHEKKKILLKFYKALKNNGIYLMDESTTSEDTETQLTHENWIKLVESFGFKFLESFHKNELNVDDCYIFLK